MSKKSKLATKILREAKAKSLTLATAESCTAGWIGKTLTDPAGSSAILKGGIIAYSNEAKINLLGVPQDSFMDGAVSESVAKAMAQGALTRLNADLAISVTGIAGPTGGSDSKPVGTVWFGLAQSGKPVEAICQNFGNKGRDSVRKDTVIYALEWLLEAIGAAT